MLKSNLLDIALGLIVVYLSMSLIASAINEWVMRIVYSRGYNLKKAVTKMLHDEDGDTAAGKAFFEHPIFTKIHEDSNKLPSYVSPHNFSHILTDVIAGYKDGESHSIELIRAGLEKEKPSPTRDLLMSFLSNSKTVEDWRILVEKWFITTMERASGWYKRKVQMSLFQVGLILAAICNVDTFALISNLKTDTQSVDALAKLAENYQNIPQDEQGNVASAFNLFNNSSLYGLGWHPPEDLYAPSKFLWILGNSLKHIPGWIISAIAISLGAPFWFDILGRVMKLKNSGTSSTQRTTIQTEKKES